MKRRQNDQSPQRSRRALFLVAGLLLASGGIRFGTHAGPAFARETADAGVEEASEFFSPSCETPAEISAVLEALRDREAKIEAKEAALIERVGGLKLAEQAFRENMSALERAEQKLAATLAIADQAAEVDLATLTAVYENMKPKDVSALFEEMDINFAAGFLGRMRPDVAASILAGISSQKAYSISVVLAGRNANVPME